MSLPLSELFREGPSSSQLTLLPACPIAVVDSLVGPAIRPKHFLLVATVGSWLGFAVQISIPAWTSENDQKERPEGRYASGNYDNVAFVAVWGLVSSIYGKACVLTGSLSKV